MNKSVIDIENEVKQLLEKEKQIDKLIIGFIDLLAEHGEIPDTVARNKKIILEFTYLTRDMKKQEAMKHLAAKYFLSISRINKIVYCDPRTLKTYRKIKE